MPLWEDGDILIALRDGAASTPPQDSRIAVYSSDGATFRGEVHLSPPLADNAAALQNLASINGYVYGREDVANPSAIWRADGEQESAVQVTDAGPFGGGGIGIDQNGNIYIGTAYSSTYEIRKYDQAGEFLDTFPYADNDPLFLPSVDPIASCLHTNLAGSILYFNDSMINWGTSHAATTFVIHRYDTEQRMLLPYLDFRSGKFLHAPARYQHFVVGLDDKIYGLFLATDGWYYVFCSDPDGNVELEFQVPDSNDSEGLAVSTDTNTILVHKNVTGAGNEASYFEAFGRDGSSQFKLFYEFDVNDGSSPWGGVPQTEGVCFARVAPSALVVTPPPVLITVTIVTPGVRRGARRPFVTLIGAN